MLHFLLFDIEYRKSDSFFVKKSKYFFKAKEFFYFSILQSQSRENDWEMPRLQIIMSACVAKTTLKVGKRLTEVDKLQINLSGIRCCIIKSGFNGRLFLI